MPTSPKEIIKLAEQKIKDVDPSIYNRREVSLLIFPLIATMIQELADIKENGNFPVTAFLIELMVNTEGDNARRLQVQIPTTNDDQSFVVDCDGGITFHKQIANKVELAQQLLDIILGDPAQRANSEQLTNRLKTIDFLACLTAENS